MDLNIEEIKKLDVDKIYNLVLPTLKPIWESFNYVNLTQQKFTDIVKNIITISKEKYLSNQPYITYIEQQLKHFLSIIVKSKLNDPQTTFEILNNFINQKLNEPQDFKEALINFKKLNKLLNTCSYIPNLDILIDLLDNNNIFNKSITLIFTKFQDKITTMPLENIFKDDFLLLSIKMYCFINNIPIKSENEPDLLVDSEIDIKENERIYLNEIRKIPLLTAEEEYKLFSQLAQGNKEARKKIIESNLRLVVSQAKKYLYNGMALLDLIQEGNIGLMKAVDRFDYKMGNKFSTYATVWIRQAISRAIYDKQKLIRLPVNVQEDISRYNKIKNQLTQKLDRPPTIQEIADTTGMSIEKINQLNDFSKKNNIVNLNSKVGDDNDTELGDLISLDKTSLEDSVILNDLPEKVQELFKKCNLQPREILVITLRFGLIDDNPLTLKEIGLQINVTRERIRQIESEALKKLRNPKYVKDFAVYLDNPESGLQNLMKIIELYSQDKYGKKAFKNYFTPKKEKKISKKRKTIYERVGYNKEIVDEIIEELPSTDKELITQYFGEDLNLAKEFGHTPGEQIVLVNSLIIKIKNRVNRKLMKDTFNNIEKETRVKEKKMPKNQNKTIYEYFPQNSKEEVDKVIATLSEDELAILKLKCGSDLVSPKNSTLNKEEIGKFHNIIAKINRRLKPNKKKNKNIYEHFPQNSKEEVDKVIATLSEDELALLKLKCGPDLVSPTYIKLDEKQRTQIYNIIIPKIRRRLLKNAETKSKQPITNEVANKKEIENKNAIKQVEEPKPEQLRINNNVLTKEDYQKILDLLRTPTFAQMLNVLSVKEAVIISLKLGYIDGKYFSTAAIAQFLQIEEIEVTQTTKKILSLFKENLNNFLDTAISYIDEPNKKKY